MFNSPNLKNIKISKIMLLKNMDLFRLCFITITKHPILHLFIFLIKPAIITLYLKLINFQKRIFSKFSILIFQ